MRTETIGDATLYLGDCRDILPTLGKVDAVVTDPPYGIGWDRQAEKDTGRKPGVSLARKGTYKASGWDDTPADAALIEKIRAMTTHQIIFGGNYFALPPARCWLVWDKENGSNQFADCELAWTNLDMPVRRISWMWNGMLRRDGEDRYGHPTQKPLEVMRWCLQKLPQACATILDPFMGSGTTGAAAVGLGRRFIGIEVDGNYFDIACRRIEDATRRPDMFVALEKRAGEIELQLERPTFATIWDHPWKDAAE